MKSENLRSYVSDHALVRYIERVHGISLDDIRHHLLQDGLYSAVKAGASNFKKNGVEFVIKNKTVVTVISDDKT